MRVAEHTKYEFWESSIPNIRNISSYYSAIKKSYAEVIKIRSDKNYLFLIGSNKKNIMITTEKVLEERKTVLLIQISDETVNEECFQQV